MYFNYDIAILKLYILFTECIHLDVRMSTHHYLNVFINPAIVTRKIPNW